MIKVLFIFVFILGLNYNGFSQNLDKPILEKPILLGSFQPWNEDLSEKIYRVGELAKDRIESNNGVFAIRVCSKEQLSVALITAYGNPFLTVDVLEKDRLIPRAKMFFLRQDKNCNFYKSALTEFWFIPEDADFPEYVEIKKVSDLFKETIVSYDYLFKEGKREQELTPQLFKQTLDYVVELMKKNRTIFVSIGFPHSNENLKSGVAKRSLDSREYLQKNGISSYRIHINKISAQEQSIELKKMNYPNIAIVGEN